MNCLLHRPLRLDWDVNEPKVEKKIITDPRFTLKKKKRVCLI